jgi:hypothetical protein
MSSTPSPGESPVSVPDGAGKVPHPLLCIYVSGFTDERRIAKED